MFKAANKTKSADTLTFGIKTVCKRFVDQIGLVITDSLIGTNNYRVAITFANWVKPSKLKTDTGPFSQSLSNMSEASLVDITESDRDDVYVYPNPTSNFVNIKVTDAEDGLVSLIAQNGEVIKQTHISNNIAQFEVANLAKAIYTIQLQTNKKSISKQITVE